MDRKMEHEMATGRIRRPWGACWMVAEGGEDENPLPFSLTAPKRGGGGSKPLVGRAPLGARAPSPLETWPTGPWGLDPATLTDFLQAKFLTSCCVSKSWVPVSKRYHNPQSADLGGQTHGAGSQNPRPSMLMRIGHVCNNNAVLVLHSPGNLACCAD